MFAKRNQQTIAGPTAVCGVGYWSGRDVRVEFCPAPIDTGIVFLRTDLPGDPRIPATIGYRAEAARRTNLRCGSAQVDMIEHVMSALAGLRIDNCEIRVDQAEMPGCDGSSLEFVKAIDAMGIVQQAAIRPRRIIRKLVRVGTRDSWIEAGPCCSGKTLLHYDLDYGPGSAIGRQSFETALAPDVFRSEIAPCRTFLLAEEAEVLRQRGLGHRATMRDLLVFDSNGPIDNPLRFRDECVRHKTLDLIGDLALAGCDLIGRFTAYRSGHQLNAELVEAVLAQDQETRIKRCA